VTPSTGVIETTCAVIAASDATVRQYDSDNSMEDASWSGLTLEKNGSGTMEDGEW